MIEELNSIDYNTIFDFRLYFDPWYDYKSEPNEKLRAKMKPDRKILFYSKCIP